MLHTRQMHFVGRLFHKGKRESFKICEEDDTPFLLSGSQKGEIPNFPSCHLKVKIWGLIIDD